MKKAFCPNTKVLILVLSLLLSSHPLFCNDSWDVVSGEVDFKNGELVLSNAVVLWKGSLFSDFVLEVQAQIQEKKGNAEACILIGADDTATKFLQIYLDQPSNSLRAITIGYPYLSSPLVKTVPFKVEMGKWYQFKVLKSGKEILAFRDGRKALHLENVELVGKRIGLRVGDGKSAFGNFSLKEFESEKRFEIGDGEIRIKMPLLVRMLEPVNIELGYTGSEPLQLMLSDSKGNVYYSSELREGKRRIDVLTYGAPGNHKLQIKDRKGKVIAVNYEVEAETLIESESGTWEKFFSNLRETVRKDRFIFNIDGKPVAMNPSWLRDHIHEMKGYKWWEEDLRSALDHFLRIQNPHGFFYEMIVAPNDPHTTFVDPEHRVVDEKNNLAYVRLEMEADIEYLMVEGVYQAWQATGDDAWLKSALPKLVKGMEYCMSDPKRWDEEHKLVKRTFSIDTWDFTYGYPADNRRIEEGMPMSIMHGDNSGMFYASQLLSRMCWALGNEKEARRWEGIARHFKEQTNRVCWNGKFYTHQIHLNHPGAPGVKEEEILSLSNTYDINRGLPDHAQAVSIIREYKRRRELTKGEYFAEWFSIHPPYPVFKAHEWMKPGTYINGGVAGFVAGELAKAAFWHGEELYALDILRRLMEKVKADGEIGFLYTPDGKDQGGGPKGWSAAAVISAIIEGLAGIRDEGKLLREVVLAPRWVITGEKRVKVVASYGPSEAYVGYIFELREKEKMLQMELFSSGTVPKFHILIPAGRKVKEVIVDGRAIPFREDKIEESLYCDFSLAHPVERARIAIRYE